MIFFKCSLITFTTLIIAIWVMPVTSDNSKEKQLGDENSKDKKPGDIEPDVAKPDDVDPDIKFLQTGCKDLLTNYTDFRNDGENIDKEGTINIVKIDVSAHRSEDETKILNQFTNQIGKIKSTMKIPIIEHKTIGGLIADIEFAKGLAKNYKHALMKKPLKTIHSFCVQKIETVEKNIFSKIIEELSNDGTHSTHHQNKPESLKN